MTASSGWKFLAKRRGECKRGTHNEQSEHYVIRNTLRHSTSSILFTPHVAAALAPHSALHASATPHPTKAKAASQLMRCETLQRLEQVGGEERREERRGDDEARRGEEGGRGARLWLPAPLRAAEGEKGLAKGCCYGFSVVSGGLREFSEIFAVMPCCVRCTLLWRWDQLGCWGSVLGV